MAYVDNGHIMCLLLVECYNNAYVQHTVHVLFNLPPQFSRLGIRGPASHVYFSFFVVCLIWVSEVGFTLFLLYLS